MHQEIKILGAPRRPQDAKRKAADRRVPDLATLELRQERLQNSTEIHSVIIPASDTPRNPAIVQTVFFDLLKMRREERAREEGDLRRLIAQAETDVRAGRVVRGESFWSMSDAPRPLEVR